MNASASSFDEDLLGGELPLDNDHAEAFARSDGADAMGRVFTRRDDDMVDDFDFGSGLDRASQSQSEMAGTAPVGMAVSVAMPAMNDVYGTLNNKISADTEINIRTIWKPWVSFCASCGRIPSVPHTGLSLYYSIARQDIDLDEPDRVDSLLENNSKLVIDYYILNLFLGFQARKPEMTSTQFEKTAKFLRGHLQSEYTALRNESLRLHRIVDIECPKDKVSGQSGECGFTKLLQDVKRRKAGQEKLNGTDIQESKERLITAEERFELLKEAFVPTDPKVGKLHALSRTCFAAQFNKCFQIAKRGEALRGHTFGMTYAEPYRVGPDGKLMTSFAISNKGKENAVGRRTCTGYVPHYDPTKDTTACDGWVFLFRFGGSGQKTEFAMGEPLPDFLDPVEMMNHHIYPSIGGGPTKEIPAATYQHTWSLLFKSCSIVCDKVTHQGRKQCQMELDFIRCPPEDITRIAGYAQSRGAGNKNQNQSYLTNQPVGVLSALGGSPYGHSRPETHAPGYLNANIDDILDKLFEVAGLGHFIAHRRDVHAEYAGCNSRKELADRGLFMAKGAISYFYESVKRSFLVAASRPMHFASPNKLNRESLRLYEVFKDPDGICVFRNPVFESPEFKELVVRVTRAQERADDNVVDMSTATENAINLAVKDNCAGPVEHLANSVSILGNKFETVWNENGVLRSEVALLQSEVNWLRGLCASHGLEVPEGPLACPTATYTYAAVSPTNSDDRHQTGFASGNAMDEEGDSESERQASESDVEAALKVIERLPAAEDTTVNGNPRRRKRAITQVEQGIAMKALGCQPTQTLGAGNKRTIYEYWKEYAYGDGDRPGYKLLEIQTKKKWRKDFPGCKNRPKAAAWCKLLKIYKLIEFYMETKFRVLNQLGNEYEWRRLTEQEALLEADKTFQDCVDTSGTPNFRDRLVPEFQKQLDYEKRASPGRVVDLDPTTATGRFKFQQEQEGPPEDS
jgi:hypothetical protein